MSTHVFQSFWRGHHLTPYEWLCLKSFIDHGHVFVLYTFDLDLKVPAGVELRDAASILDETEFFVYEKGPGKGSPSAFANLFRYNLLRDLGGWWVDTDVVCLANDIPQFKEFFARQDAAHINGAVLFFEPKHPLMIRCFDEAKRAGRGIRWGDTGPRLLTRLLAETDSIDRAMPSSSCYPVHFSEALDVLKPSRTEVLREQIAGSLFLHLWNETLKQNGVEKFHPPPRGSLLRELVEHHQIEGWNADYQEELLTSVSALHAEVSQLVHDRLVLRTELSESQATGSRMVAELDMLRAANARLQSELTALQENHTRARIEVGAKRKSIIWPITATLRRAQKWLSRNVPTKTTID